MTNPYNNYKKMHENLNFICLSCGHCCNYKSAMHNCSNCHYTFFKVAKRDGGMPTAFQMDYQDPYKKQWNVGDGQGMDAVLVRPADEETGGGLGTRFRGEGTPSGFSSKDQYEKQRHTDIPYSDHMFMDSPIGEGTNNGTFFDPSSPLSEENIVTRELSEPQKSDPIGPHNMQKYKNVFNKVRHKQKGI